MVGLFEAIVFAILSVLLIGFSIATITAKDIVRASMALMLSLLTVAGIYVTLNAQFLGVIQILVYIGAIGVLILFAVMLTKKSMESDQDVR
ncbi:MAG: NADH-quinone oxidoreductase subunit J [Methanosarcinaceae archaeon]|nr:NADH-quinone oxidoreductase subunit J [Methanosarcinaceae archaeon]